MIEPELDFRFELIDFRGRGGSHGQAPEAGRVGDVLAILLGDFPECVLVSQGSADFLPELFYAPAYRIHCRLGEFGIVEHQLAQRGVANQPALSLDFIVVVDDL